jgi:Na+/glutamate symporter
VANYDPAILQKFADKMYARAMQVIVAWAVLGFFLGGIIGGAALFAAAQGLLRELGLGGGSGACVVSLGSAVLGCIIGVLIGIEKAFWLKLEAQKILCQLQTEVNTRGANAPLPPMKG